MKRKGIIFFLIIFGFEVFCNEFSKPEFTVGINLGFNLGAYKESTCSVVNQGIAAPKIGLDFGIKSNNFQNIIHLDYAFIKPISNQTKQKLIYKEYDPVSGEPYITECVSFLAMHRINLSYDLQYLIKNSECQLYAGGSFQANAYLQFENYPSITGLLSFGPSVSGNYKLGSRSGINFYGSIPLLGFGVRPPFAGADALFMKYAEEEPLKILTLGNFLSLHNYQALFARVEYLYQINSWCVLNTGLDFEYSRVAVPAERPLFYCTGDIKAGIQFLF